MRNFAFMTVIALFSAAAPVQAQPPEKDDGAHFFFKDGDTIVIMGDSITEQLLYSNYVEMWSTVRFPEDEKLTFRNVGIGGDRSPGGNTRFARDVLAHKATVLTVDFGMNDGHSNTFSEPAFQTYLKGLQGIADQAKAAKIRVAWITTQPVEPRNVGPVLTGVNDTLERFSAGVEQIALKNDGVFVDQFHPYLAVLAKARATDPKNFNVTGGDPVHPGPPGQVVMAAAILRGLDFQRLVSRVAIDGDKVMTENCDVKIGSPSQPDSVTFTRLDFGLPFFPEDAKSILQWTPLRDDMNRYWLQVKGLKEGKYAVQLNDTKVAEYSAAELGQGVNMASAVLAAGPIADQVKKVWKAVQDKNRYFHDQVFRGVVLAGNDPKVYAERMQKMPELDAAVRAELVLKPHTVTVAPAK